MNLAPDVVAVRSLVNLPPDVAADEQIKRCRCYYSKVQCEPLYSKILGLACTFSGRKFRAGNCHCTECTNFEL